jgi:hypothetical protein
MEASSWLGVVRATPQCPLPSLLGPERPGDPIVHFSCICQNEHEWPSGWPRKKTHFRVTRITSQTDQSVR